MEQTNFEEELDLTYCRASTGKRFANYIIDMIVFYILVILLGIAIGFFKPELLPEGDGGILERIISLICYGLLMFIIEAACHGKTLGKVITGTKAVNMDGSDIGFQKAFTRNIIRSIPFNALSAFGTPCNPWHDAWSDTMVVDEKKLDLQRRKEIFYTELRSSND
ncbi:MAG: RDD family protein [Pedobacter sp.]|uniref:RDD family protein n=1 Tax=Pedobacter sp. TaxID=1411316 RepID=UPI002808CB20|nr:RDD family protein [Pedobacter sp.]MDQ8004478.1 RDD family protein [Pedobacter sp.]